MSKFHPDLSGVKFALWTLLFLGGLVAVLFGFRQINGYGAFLVIGGAVSMFLVGWKINGSGEMLPEDFSSEKGK